MRAAERAAPGMRAAATPRRDDGRLRRLNRGWVAILAVTAIAAVVRLWGLSSPPAMAFDENYYAKAGCILIGGSDATCRIESPNERAFREQEWDVGSFVHPPLGKWTIGMGIKAFGMDAFGWRIGSAVAGTLAVTGVALMAQLLFGRPIWTPWSPPSPRPR